MLDERFFASLDGVSITFNHEYHLELKNLVKMLEDTGTLAIGGADSTKGFEDFAQKVKEIETSRKETFEKMVKAAIEIKEAYCEVTKAAIGAVPGSDNGHGYMLLQ
jgi:hypothetical protein